MANYWVNLFLVRIVLPIVLTGATVWRPTALSIVYLALVLYSPVVPIPTKKTMAGHAAVYLKTSIALCFLATLTQLTFHIVLLLLPPYAHFLLNCQFVERLFRHIGLVRLDSATVWEILYWLGPEIIVFPAILTIYLVCRCLTTLSVEEEERPVPFQPRDSSSVKDAKADDRTSKIINFLGRVGTYAVLASLCLTASLTPSVQGAFYFVVFIAASTWWACNRELRRGFAVLCRIVTIVVILHIVALLAYQNEWPQSMMPADSRWARYLALVAIYRTDCNDPRNVKFANEDDWFPHAYSIRLFWLYYILALQSRFLTTKPAKKVARLSSKLENLDAPLSRHVSIRRRTPSQRWQSARRKARKLMSNDSTPVADERTPLMRFGSGRTGLLQDSTGSVIVQDGQQEDGIQMQTLSDGVSDSGPSIFEHVLMAIYSIFQLLFTSSYLAMNILMMTWSIMYHSWTTFILLLWALILWMVPDKRVSMMRCTPFIVFYCIVLLLGQYVYSMNFTEDELPTVVNGIKMSEIGFSKIEETTRWHLVVKCLFMLVFWITMKQYMIEWKRRRRMSTLRDMVAPLHVSVSTATTAMQYETPELKSQFMKDVGVILRQLLTKFWIAVVAIMLFICGISGEHITVFRIIYMSLFLFFVITFEISWKLWRKIMYGFWVTVIAYSIFMLILVYTYQFRNFPKYWSYWGINEQLQMDIGLETYETKDLFIKLLTPTFFVIITVIQIHYFHSDFLKITHLEALGQENSLRRQSLGRSFSFHIPITSPADVNLHEKTTYTLKELRKMSKLEKIHVIREVLRYLENFYNYTWSFLELHMQKIIFTSVMLLCVNDVNAINFFFVLAIVIVINFKRNTQIVSCNVIAIIIALLMVANMLYQIKYIDHSNWNITCENPSGNTTVYNIAEWFGIKKGEPGQLAELLKGYIGIITVTALRKLIRVRQWFHRIVRGQPIDTPYVMFPEITRTEADRSLPNCLKFLFNYGFYKFGLEFCLVGIVILIGTRLDFYSVLYSFWLLIFFPLRRSVISKIWPIFLAFSSILLPIQYMLVVAPPTWFCIHYPWSDSPMLRRLQEWMYFPDPKYQPNSLKLVCDFLLLMMIVRQSLVFKIEKHSKSTGVAFPGGHNNSVHHQLEDLNFVNPVKDYVSHIHSWLDVFKRGILMSLMWITLSIMFLAGTKRTNLFSLGYLIGAFVFLWQGSDFYLRPVNTILRWWNVMLGYNVVVILLKSILQGVGCVLVQQLQTSACWLVQLLGIACIRKFIGLTGTASANVCQVPREDIGMVWDGLCFTFLIMQKRLFRSYYFFHIVDETKAMTILASRGAELLEELHQKRVEIQESVEKNVLQKLKDKMDKIKANQQKIQGPSYREPETHKIDYLYPGTRPLYRARAPKTNREAVRSGDYYMFDDLDDDTTDILADAEAERKERERQRVHETIKHRARRMTVAELMNTLIKTDIEIATHIAMHGGTEKDALRLRRRSLPLTRKKSSMSYLSARSETDTALATEGTQLVEMPSDEIDMVEKELMSVDLTKTPPASDEGENEKDLKKTKKGISKEDEGEEEEEEEIEEEEEEGEEKKKEGQVERQVSFLTYCNFVLVMVNSVLISMTRYLNRFSRDYRYISRVLTKEKKILKSKPDFRMGYRLGINQMWQPIPFTAERWASDASTEGPIDAGEGPSQPMKDNRKWSLLTVPYIRVLAPSLERGLERSSSSTHMSQATSLHEEEDEPGELSEVDQPPIIQLAASMWFGILAHSSILCYFMVFLHQIMNASVLSTPLPLMVFCWGSLSIPRPSKTFWVTLIAYTEAIVVVKCMFQLELIPWNQKALSNHPLYGPKIMGVERNPNYALWDLLLLLMVFFHRLMLKSLGQWTAPSLKPRKTVPSTLEIVQQKRDDDLEPSDNPWRDIPHGDIKTPQGRKFSVPLKRVRQEEEEKEKDEEEEKSMKKVEKIEEQKEEGQGKTIAVQGEEMHPYVESLPSVMNMTVNKYMSPMRDFFANILNPVGKEKTNVYAYMFLCDFFNFLLLIFGFSAFGTQQSDGGVAAYLQENRVPMPFLLMLLLQFALIVIDRALFLKKSIVGKLIFQYCLIFGVHIWMFFILPSVTERQFHDRLPPQIWYMMKCFYLLLAAYQLRQGYPTRILGNFLCKKYTLVNYVLFKGFMLVPFLFELRAVMDWIWTDTSMTIMDWFKMEDIFASIYQIKCIRVMEINWPAPRGQKRSQISKYLTGGGALCIMIGLIWFPLLIFALGGTVGVSNLPYEVSMKISIGPYEPIYSMTAQSGQIIGFTEEEFANITDLYARDKAAVTFLESYVNTDVAAVRLSGFSRKIWAISPPDRERLKMDLESNTSQVVVHTQWSVARKTHAKDMSDVTTKHRYIEIPPYVNGVFNPTRKILADMLIANQTTNATITVPNAIPKFLKVTSTNMDVISQLMKLPSMQSLRDEDEEEPDKNYLYRDINLHLSSEGNQQWWIVKEICDDNLYYELLNNVPLNDCEYIMMFLFNDKAFPEGLSFISGFGILGLYTTAVIVISQMMRKIVTDMAPKIMFDDMPYVDRILRLCLDIYLVRESGDLCLEEDLFAKLIFLYRSPETLIRWTRPPEEGERPENVDEEDDSEMEVRRTRRDEKTHHD